MKFHRAMTHDGTRVSGRLLDTTVINLSDKLIRHFSFTQIRADRTRCSFFASRIYKSVPDEI